MQFFSLLFVLIFLMLLWESARWVFALAALGIAALVIWGLTSAAERKRLADDRLRELVDLFRERLDQHTHTLAKKFRQSVYRDDYGALVFDKWHRERDYFIDKVLVLEWPDLLQVVSRQSIETDIDKKIFDAYEEESDLTKADVDGLSPLDFEHHCAALLKQSGWIARVTKASGDQGIDIVADFGNVRAIFQCKKLNKPVGNAAVQEAIAGRAFDKSDIAAVVTNTSYTSSARQLASSAGIHLLHFTDIQSFTESIRGSSE